MQPEFTPIFGNPHLLTIAGNFWRRKIDEKRFPATRREYRIDASTRIVVYKHKPDISPRGQLFFLHGLEGSADAGYIQSFAQAALLRGFIVHRANLRTCGGTEELCETMYHSGLTADTRQILEEIALRIQLPIFLIGFSLGGNVALKLTGELGNSSLIAGTCAVSTPIDLAACVRAIGKPSNMMYSRRFLERLRRRVAAKSKLSPNLYTTAGLNSVKTIWEFDDRFTAPLFGFGTAANYYATQSSIRYLDKIKIPTLLITAKDDPLVPFEIYKHPALQANPFLTVIAPDKGGHLGFISRRRPRFWVDETALKWIDRCISSKLKTAPNKHVALA